MQENLNQSIDGFSIVTWKFSVSLESISNFFTEGLMIDGGLLHGERLYVDKLMTFPIFCWFVKKYFVMLRMTG